MITELINKLNNYIDNLKNSKVIAEKELDYYLKINNVINARSVITKEELNNICDSDVFSEEEIKKLEFIFNVLFRIETEIELDDGQERIYNKFKEFITNKTHELSDKIDTTIVEEINGLISELNSNKKFTKFDELKNIFEKLQIPLDERLEIIKELILTNYEKIPVSEEEIEELEIYNNDEDSIKKIFENYGLDYELLKEQHKEVLRKKVNLSALEDIFEAIKQLDENYMNHLMKKNQELFMKLLMSSSGKIINRFIDICNNNGINAVEKIYKHPSILIPNGLHGTKTFKNPGPGGKSECAGSNTNFEENVAFFNKVGINVSVVDKKCFTVLVRSSEIIKSNYYILTNLYDIPIDENQSMISLSLGTAISYLDRLIESSSLGYEYAKNNQSILYNSEDILLYKLRIKELYNEDEEFKMAVDSSGVYQLPEKPIFYIRNGKIVKNAVAYGDGPSTVEELEKLLSTTDVHISDGYEIITKSILPNIININMEELLSNQFISLLENNYKINNYMYEINNTRISRIKFLRICTMFIINNKEINSNEVNFALTYNSLLTQNDLNNINEFINSVSFSRNGGVN